MHPLFLNPFLGKVLTLEDTQESFLLLCKRIKMIKIMHFYILRQDIWTLKVKLRWNRKQKRTTCFTTLLQSDVASIRDRIFDPEGRYGEFRKKISCRLTSREVSYMGKKCLSWLIILEKILSPEFGEKTSYPNRNTYSPTLLKSQMVGPTFKPVLQK